MILISSGITPAVSTTVRSTKKKVWPSSVKTAHWYSPAPVGKSSLSLPEKKHAWKLSPSKGRRQRPDNHVGNFLSCIKSRELPKADIAIGARVAKMSHLANVSCRLQRKCVGTMPTACLSVIMRQQHYQRLTIAPRGNYPNCKRKNIISRKTLNIFDNQLLYVLLFQIHEHINLIYLK